MRFTAKTSLSVAMGIVGLPLMLWDIHNERMIRSMGMAWDTGAPLWPYQTPYIILSVLNTPVYFLANPLSNLFKIFGPLHYLIFFPLSVAWWWLVGWYLDRRSFVRQTKRESKQAIAFFLLALAFLLIGANELWETGRWWWIYSRSLLSVTDLILLKSLGPVIWSFIFGAAASWAALRRSHLWNKEKQAP